MNMERNSGANRRERLSQLTQSVAPVAFAQDRVIPVAAALEPLLGEGGITRGHIIGCRGTAALSLAFATVARASAAGSWVAAAGLPTLGAQAANEAGIALERLVMVTIPVGITEAAWANTVSALIDGFDIVVLRQSSLCSIRAGTARRLQARLQARGSVLVMVGHPGDFSVDVALNTTAGTWEGLGNGAGRLVRRKLTISAGGRRVPKNHQIDVWLPGAGGGIEAVNAQPAAKTTAETAAETGAETGAKITAKITAEAMVVPLRKTG